MKKITKYILDILLTLIPLICGYLVNSMLFPFYPFIMQLVFLIFWCFVGLRFSKWNTSTWKSFLIGNSLWFISFILFIWQFNILNDAERSIELAMLSQHYMLAFVYGAAKLFPFLHSGTIIMLSAYILMFITFSIGYLANKKKYKLITMFDNWRLHF